MKKFIYIAVGIILISSLMPTANFSAPAGGLEITIESQEASPESLLQAKDIISRRLIAYGIADFEIESHPEKRQLSIRFKEDFAVEPILPLLASVGRLEFCEVFTQAEAFQLIREGKSREKWERWIPLDVSGDGNGAVVAGIAEGDIAGFGKFALQQQAEKTLPGKLKFAFGYSRDEKGQRELYALRYRAGGTPLLTGGSVAESRVNYNENTGAASIGLIFKDEGSARWAQATKENLSRPLAIVFDGLVYFAPRVMAEIHSGNAQITGDFSAEEARQMSALIQGGELPVPFRVKAVNR